MLLLIKPSGRYEAKFHTQPSKLILQMPSDISLQQWEPTLHMFGPKVMPAKSHTYDAMRWSNYDLTPANECESTEYRLASHAPYFITVIRTHSILSVKIDGNELAIQLPQSNTILEKLRMLVNNL